MRAQRMLLAVLLSVTACGDGGDHDPAGMMMRDDMSAAMRYDMGAGAAGDDVGKDQGSPQCSGQAFGTKAVQCASATCRPGEICVNQLSNTCVAVCAPRPADCTPVADCDTSEQCARTCGSEVKNNCAQGVCGDNGSVESVSDQNQFVTCLVR